MAENFTFRESGLVQLNRLLVDKFYINVAWRSGNELDLIILNSYGGLSSSPATGKGSILRALCFSSVIFFSGPLFAFSGGIEQSVKLAKSNGID